MTKNKLMQARNFLTMTRNVPNNPVRARRTAKEAKELRRVCCQQKISKEMIKNTLM